MRIIMALVFAGLMTTSAVAFDGDQPAAAKKKERKICKEVGRSGTRLPLRKCMTRTEWTDYDVNKGEGGLAKTRASESTMGKAFPGASAGNGN